MSDANTDRELIVPDGGFWPAPQVPQPNIYPMEWHVETEKLAAIYQKSKVMAWNPADLPWDDLRPEDFTREQRLGIMYWFSVLANFDASGPAVFARATIRAFEKHEEDPVRKCFFSITRDEMNHEECCQRAIGRLRNRSNTPPAMSWFSIRPVPMVAKTTVITSRPGSLNCRY